MTVKRRLAVGAVALAAVLVPAAIMSVPQVSADVQPKSGFVDVPDSHPYASYITDLRQNGKIAGEDATHFAPDKNLTRAEFAAMLVKVFSLQPSGPPVPFQDLGNAEWARQAIQAAYGFGIVHGYDSAHFGPDDPVTREEAAAMVWNCLSKIGLKPTPGDASGMIAGVSDWAKDAVSQVVLNKLYGPEVTPSSGYQPQRNMTRAEAAALFDTAIRFLDGCGCVFPAEEFKKALADAAKQLPEPPKPSPNDPLSLVESNSVFFKNPARGLELLGQAMGAQEASKDWRPGDSVVLGRALFSNNFKDNGDGTVTVTIPVFAQLGFSDGGAKYWPPEDPSHENPVALEQGQTYTLQTGDGAELDVWAGYLKGSTQEGYNVVLNKLNNRIIVNTTRCQNGYLHWNDWTTMDALLKGLGLQ